MFVNNERVHFLNKVQVLTHLKIRRKSEVASGKKYRIKNGVANLHFTASVAYGIADVHLVDCWPRIMVVGDQLRSRSLAGRAAAHVSADVQ